MKKHLRRSAALERRAKALEKVLEVWRNDLSLCTIPPSLEFRPPNTRWDNLLRGARSIQFIKKTEPIYGFRFRHHTLQDSLWNDWCKVGQDFYVVLVNNADQLSVKPSLKTNSEQSESHASSR